MDKDPKSPESLPYTQLVIAALVLLGVVAYAHLHMRTRIQTAAKRMLTLRITFRRRGDR